MAITQRQVGVGVGGASVGFIGGEAIHHAQERDIISARTGRFIAGSVAAASIGLTAGAASGLVPLSPTSTAFIAGVGAGSTAWYVGRDAGLAPRITLDIPDEVNVAGPLVTASIIGVVTLAIGTLTSGVL